MCVGDGTSACCRRDIVNIVFEVVVVPGSSLLGSKWDEDELHQLFCEDEDEERASATPTRKRRRSTRYGVRERRVWMQGAGQRWER